MLVLRAQKSPSGARNQHPENRKHSLGADVLPGVRFRVAGGMPGSRPPPLPAGAVCAGRRGLQRQRAPNQGCVGGVLPLRLFEPGHHALRGDRTGDRCGLRRPWPAAPCLGPPGGGLAPGRSPFGFASRLCTLSMWHLSAIPANNQLNLRSTTRLATGGPSTPLTPFRSLGLRAGEGFRTQFLSAQAESLGQPYCGPRDGPVHTPPWKWATTRLSSGRSSLAFGIVLVLAGARLTGSLVVTDLSLGSLVLPLTYEPVNAVCPVL